MIGGHPIVYVLLSQLFRHFIAFVSLIHGSIESHDVRGHFLKHMAVYAFGFSQFGKALLQQTVAAVACQVVVAMD